MSVTSMYFKRVGIGVGEHFSLNTPLNVHENHFSSLVEYRHTILGKSSWDTRDGSRIDIQSKYWKISCFFNKKGTKSSDYQHCKWGRGLNSLGVPRFFFFSSGVVLTFLPGSYSRHDIKITYLGMVWERCINNN